MKQPATFDSFYAEARDRLLVQTFALTGDLAASRRAVRDAFVVGWHRWRRLQRLEDPESVLRPLAWRLAQRRHTARMWHRDKDLPDEVKATLDALGRLSLPQRHALVLTHCASVTMAQMAREVGLPPEAAASELQAGAARLALLREVPTSSLTALFEPVAAAATGGGARWPRPTIIRRAGASRRRRHTGAGVVAVAAAVLVSGVVVSNGAGVRPTLDRAAAAPVHGGALKADVATLTDDDMASGDQVDQALSGPGGRDWTVGRTFDNQAGSGLVLPCQSERYADPDGDAALVRTYLTPTRGDGAHGARGESVGAAEPAAVEFTEASATPDAAATTYRTTLDWFADCGADRVQLLASRTPAGVGDESVQLVLHAWADPMSTFVVGIARTGLYTTTAVTSRPGDDVPDRVAGARFLAAAVNAVCTLDGAGGCADKRPHLTTTPPVPVGQQPALLSTVDLPPVSGVDSPWAGSDPSRATTNLAATGCDKTRFTGRFDKTQFTHSATRTFLIPDARPALPDTFGLTETVAALPTRSGRALVAQVRHRLATCEDRSLGSKVTRVLDRHTTDKDLTVWTVSVEVSAKQRVDFEMAILREGTTVGQIGLVSAPGVAMADGAFPALAQRALSRLPELAAPGS